MFFRIIMCFVILSISFGAKANYQGESKNNSRWGLHLESFRVNEETAKLYGISEDNYGLGFDYTAEFINYLNLNIGLTFLMVDDEAEFQQRVINTLTKAESTKSSSIDGGAINIDFGPKYSFLGDDRVTVGLNFGYRYIDVNRKISNCEDCSSESVGIDSDTYIKPFIAFRLTQSFMLGLSYMKYSDELGADSTAQLKFEWLAGK
ncbi:MAG: hypothetical protein HRU20_27815 [Pseudomonadales bacterium]|nr:hypothetical protein [Pseudomonadales bacterium]